MKSYNLSGGGRNSSIELLRIIAMFAILFWHMIHHGFLTLDNIDPTDKLLLESLNWGLLWHVNIFLLITGYFGVNLKLKSLLFLICKLLIITILVLIVLIILGEDIGIIEFPRWLLHNSFGGAWWFVRYYIQLLLISPILNLVKQLDDKSFLRIFCVLVFLNLVIGFLLKNDFNKDGFSLNHFVFMYYLGYALHRFESNIKIQNIYLLIGFVLSTVLSIITGVLMESFFYGYNNPFVLICSLCIFIFFSRLCFRNTIINWIAARTLGVYLITDEYPHVRPLLAKHVKDIYYNSGSLIESLLYAFLLSVILFIICILIDKILSVVSSFFAEKISAYKLFKIQIIDK